MNKKAPTPLEDLFPENQGMTSDEQVQKLCKEAAASVADEGVKGSRGYRRAIIEDAMLKLAVEIVSLMGNQPKDL